MAGSTKKRDQDRLVLDGRYNSYLSKGEWRICKRKATRVDIRSTDLPVYISYPDLSPHQFAVSMIAELGAQYITEDWDVSTLQGHLLNCVLQLGQSKFTIRSRVVNVGQGYASVEFLDPPFQARHIIRELFKAELIAARLAPFHSFSSLVAGPTHTTIYSDGSTNTLELLMKNDHLEAISGELEILDMKFSWARNRPAEFARMSDRRIQGPTQRNRLLSFIRNLPDLHPKIRQAVEQAFRA